MKRTLILMTVLTVMGKLLGILRESTLASLWGTSYIVDAYLTAGAVGGIIFGWLLSVYMCYTPVYIKVCNNKSSLEGKQFTGNLIAIMLIVYSVLAVLLYIFRVPLINVIVPGYSMEAKTTTAYFLSLAASSILVVPIINLLKAYLDANKHFVCSLLTDSLFGVFQIGMIILGGLVSVKFLAQALIVPYIFQLVVIIAIIMVLKLSFPVRLALSSDVKEIGVLLVPVCISSIMTEINSFVDKLFASSLLSGSVSILNYAFSIREAIMNIFMYGFITVSFPLLSQYVAEHNNDKLKTNVQNSLQSICLVFIPLMVGSIILSKSIIQLLYERGSFGLADVLSTQKVLIIYLLAILPIVLRTYLLKVFYAFQNTKIAMFVGCLSMGTNVILNFVLVEKFGRLGLVAATTISDMIVVPLLLYSLRYKIIGLDYRKFGVIFLKCLLSSIVMGIVVLFLNGLLPSDSKVLVIFNSVVCVFVGAGVYYLMALFLNVGEVKAINKWIIKTVFRILKIKNN